MNSHNKFAVAAGAPIILNILLISVLIYGKYLNDDIVVYLSYAVSLAGLIQLIILIIFSRKYYKAVLNFDFKIPSSVKLFFKKLLPSVFSSGVTQINILIGTIIASFQASAVSYLYYADRIYQINLAIAGIAIGTIILPNLSKNVQSQDKSKIKLIQNKALELSLFLSLPATMALMIAPTEITSALFGYGEFDILSVNNSSKALFYFAIGLPAFSIIKIFSSFLFARHNTRIPFYFSLISVIINIIISLYFFKDVGFIIIPIATTISSWINCLLLFIYLKNNKYFSIELNLIKSLIKIFISTIITSILFYNLVSYFSNKLNFESEYKLLVIILLVTITFVTYIIISILTKAFKISDIKLKY